MCATSLQGLDTRSPDNTWMSVWMIPESSVFTVSCHLGDFPIKALERGAQTLLQWPQIEFLARGGPLIAPFCSEEKQTPTGVPAHTRRLVYDTLAQRNNWMGSFKSQGTDRTELLLTPGICWFLPRSNTSKCHTEATINWQGSKCHWLVMVTGATAALLYIVHLMIYWLKPSNGRVSFTLARWELIHLVKVRFCTISCSSRRKKNIGWGTMSGSCIVKKFTVTQL